MEPSLQTLTLRVADVRAEARDVVTLELKAPGGGSLPSFEPGGHLEITLPNGLVRHYSLVNDWRETDRYVIAVGRAADGRGGSACVHAQVRCGTELKVSAPRNNFPLKTEADRHLFIAGGIGITPIMAMIRWCEANGRPWKLVYAARSRLRAAFYEELSGFGPDHVRFHFDDEQGGVPDAGAVIADVGAGETVYCCGPAPLMEAVRDAGQGLPAGTLRFEWFNAPSEAAADTVDGEFRVKLRRSGLDLAIPADRSILQVLEEHGIDVPFSCREGLCGTCQTAVCAGQPDHRDYVLSDEERATNKTMMVCVSRALSPVLEIDL